MRPEQSKEPAGEMEPASAAQFAHATDPAETPAWEKVAAGRYMPRRIRGSCKGRALG
jgi:hypothetical protein